MHDGEDERGCGAPRRGAAGSGVRVASTASASAAGRSSWRDAVAGSASAVNAPPCAGAIATSATPAAADVAAGNHAPEQCPTRLVGDHCGKRREHGRAVQHDVDRVGARDLRDQREEAVPQRERVAGMEPAVRELVERVQREVVEREELLYPREMEEAVTADVSGDVPEEQSEHRPGGEDPAAARNARAASAAGEGEWRPVPPTMRRTRVTPSEADAANVIESAANTSASDQAIAADRRRTPSARATSAPGASTTATPKTSWTSRSIRRSATRRRRSRARRRPRGSAARGRRGTDARGRGATRAAAFARARPRPAARGARGI